MKSLEQLCKIPAVSGFEKMATEEFVKIFEEYGFSEIKVDKNGNIYGTKFVSDKAANILIDAHIDEIGLIVKEIKDNGFILFDTVGGVDRENLYCKEVTIYGKKEIYGVIGAIPPHLSNEK